jgi:hypothetical protein
MDPQEFGGRGGRGRNVSGRAGDMAIRPAVRARKEEDTAPSVTGQPPEASVVLDRRAPSSGPLPSMQVQMVHSIADARSA